MAPVLHKFQKMRFDHRVSYSSTPCVLLPAYVGTLAHVHSRHRTITAASKDTSTPRHSSMYAPIECLLSCFVNRSSLPGNGFHSYPSSTPGCKRTSAGSTFIPSFFSYSFVSQGTVHMSESSILI